MHELSIALGIVDIAEKEVMKNQAEKISEIELVIGEFSGVQLDALEFVWESAVAKTVLENARRVIHQVKGKARCLDCDHKYDIKQIYDNCPMCKSYIKDIYQGKELLVKRLIVEK